MAGNRERRQPNSPTRYEDHSPGKQETLDNISSGFNKGPEIDWSKASKRVRQALQWYAGKVDGAIDWVSELFSRKERVDWEDVPEDVRQAVRDADPEVEDPSGPLAGEEEGISDGWNETGGGTVLGDAGSGSPLAQEGPSRLARGERRDRARSESRTALNSGDDESGFISRIGELAQTSPAAMSRSQILQINAMLSEEGEDFRVDKDTDPEELKRVYRRLRDSGGGS